MHSTSSNVYLFQKYLTGRLRITFDQTKYLRHLMIRLCRHTTGVIENSACFPHLHWRMSQPAHPTPSANISQVGSRDTTRESLKLPLGSLGGPYLKGYADVILMLMLVPGVGQVNTGCRFPVHFLG